MEMLHNGFETLKFGEIGIKIHPRMDEFDQTQLFKM